MGQAIEANNVGCSANRRSLHEWSRQTGELVKSELVKSKGAG
jgi:hypothetical protein